ncbi:polynucleotide 5'-hydroxyl-kinase NOL9 [Orussus abietinus]|uniref:polynucleotide 5'-hydroxyl-kinase NOL9 n=1 Tax=Orussus abietinus TaxID=222816 RepID=UPI000626A6AF|nr:polynucleotide 5'-hydroxyl-kinase NOL9 [Orussus abietinus]
MESGKSHKNVGSPITVVEHDSDKCSPASPSKELSNAKMSVSNLSSDILDGFIVKEDLDTETVLIVTGPSLRPDINERDKKDVSRCNVSEQPKKLLSTNQKKSYNQSRNEQLEENKLYQLEKSKQEEKSVRNEINLNDNASNVQTPNKKRASSHTKSLKKRSNSSDIYKDLLDDINDNEISNKKPQNHPQNGSSTCNNLLNDTADITMAEVVPSFRNLNPSAARITSRFYSLEKKVIVIMETGSKFCFSGKLKVTVLYGGIEVYGYVLDSPEKTVEVYSPRSQGLVSITSIDNSSNCNLENTWKLLTLEGVERDVETHLQRDLNQCENHTVILLENIENELTSFLSAYCPYKLFPKIEESNNSNWTHPKRAEINLQANFYFENSGRQLIIDPRWKEEVIDKILEQSASGERSCTLLAGGKGVGKSTMVRFLINNLLRTSKVVLVDLDPGQTECTPPGCISINVIKEPLLGANFTHLKTPFYKLYIGDVDIVRCIPRYIEGVKKLINCLKNASQLFGLPVVVNTMGFCQGIGWDIAVYIIKMIQPTDIIQIGSKHVKNNFDEPFYRNVINRQNVKWISWDKDIPMNKPAKHRLHLIQSQAEERIKDHETSNMKACQHRDVVMLAYLSQILQNREKSRMSIYTQVQSITDVVPYKIPFDSLCVSLIRSVVPASHVLAAMNGNIVALCGVDLQNDLTETSAEEEGLKDPKVLARAPLSTCYGFGIVRGIDMEKREVFLNTPLSAALLQYVNCFVGCSPIPLNLLQLNHPGAPYSGSHGDLPTSRDTRRGCFKMGYQDQTNTGNS